MTDLPPKPLAPIPADPDDGFCQHMPPLRAAFVIQKLAGLSGGAERVFIETAEAMAARGISVRIITLDADPSRPLAFGRGHVAVTSVLPHWLRRWVHRRVQSVTPRPEGRAHPASSERLVKAIPNVFPLTHLKWQLTHGMFQRALTREFRRRPVDVIVAFLPPAITAAARAGKNLGIPVVGSTHNVPALDFGPSDRWDQNPVYRTRARAALETVARVTVLQPEFQTWFNAEVRPNITVMPNPVSRLCNLPDPAPAREALILGVGRLTRIKRWDLLVEAFALVAPELPDWSLRLIGSGPEQATLQDRITALGLDRRIAILPPKPEIGEEYDRASVLVHPSEFEGFGLSVAEAMAHGLPVIAFADCAGVNALVTDNCSGVLLKRPEGDPLAARCIANAILGMSQNPDFRARLGHEAATITRRFHRGTIHDNWAHLLHEVAARHPPPRS